MAKLIRCPAGHIYDSAAHEACPECARTGLPKPAKDARPAQVSKAARGDEDDSGKAEGTGKRGVPLTWLIGGGAAAALLIAAAVFLLRPSGAPVQPSDANSDPDFQACLKPSDVQAEACERAIASGKFSGNALSSLYNNRGIGHQKKNDLDAAIADFAEAIKLNGRSAFAFNNRGNAYRNQHKEGEALEDFAKAIEIDAKYISPYNNRGLLYLDKGEFDRAIADFDQVVRLDANYLRAYWNRGSAYLKKGERDRAIADYKKALSLNPDDTTRKMIEAELNQAAALPAPQAAATNPTPASAPGPSAQDAGQPTASSQAAPSQQADAGNSGTATADTSNGKEPDPASSSKVLKSTDEVLADPDFKACAMGTPQIADCDRAISSGKFEKEGLAALYNARGEARYFKHDLDGAVDDYTKALEADGTFASSYSNRGLVYLDRKDYDRAIAEFDHAIKIDGDKYYNPFEDRALAYWSKGDTEHAAADYKKALSLNPSDKARQDIEKSLKDIEAGAKYPPGSAPPQKQGSAMKAQLPPSGPWAAIATDGNGRWGYAVEQPSQDVARTAALKDCGGSGCKVLDALQASCIAYAESREGGYWYFGYFGPNESAVQNDALNACNKAAPAGSCKLVKSICGPDSAYTPPDDKLGAAENLRPAPIRRRTPSTA